VLPRTRRPQEAAQEPLWARWRAAGHREHHGAVPDVSWPALAACRGVDPSLFVVEKGHVEQVAAAKKICARCVVRQPCLAEAYKLHDTEMVRGALTPAERHKLQREHGVVVSPVRLAGRDRWGHLPSVDAEPT
jgi:WhiB family redox-sensing transcriptional regulator